MHDDETAERGPDRAAEVVADAVGRDRARQVLLRHETGQDRQPSGRVQRPRGAEQERRQQQNGGRGEIERHQRREDRDQRRDRAGNGDDEPPGIDDVGDRAGRKGEEEHRQVGRGVHQRDVERIEVERRHQPARRGVVHRNADQRRRARQPDEGESGMRECAEPMRVAGRRLLGSGDVHPNGSFRP